MKKIIRYEMLMISFTIALLVAAFPVSAAEQTSPREMVAKVNGVIITKTQLDKATQKVIDSAKRQGKHIDSVQLLEIKKENLEELINRELLLQASKKANITVGNDVIDKQLEQIKKNLPDEAAYQKTLRELEMTENDLRSQIKDSVAIQLFINYKIFPQINVSEKETQDYYNANQTYFNQPEKVRASHILIVVDPAAEKSQKDNAFKKIEDIYQKVKTGENFGLLAKKYSQCPSSAKEGDLGFFQKGQMVKPFEDVAFSLKPGEVSGVVTTQFGYHIIKIIEKKPEKKISYEDAKKQIHSFIVKQKSKMEVEKYGMNLKEKASIERFLANN
jgi:peptidyl-prolyl cis-trans isomerase C